MKPISQAEFARDIGVSRMAVSQAIKDKRCPCVTIKGRKMVDPSDPEAIEYAQVARLHKASNGRVPRRASKRPHMATGVSEEVDLRERKMAAEAALKEVQLKTAAEQYYRQLEALIDIGTLRQKMNAFMDVLVTHLIYLPEEAADQLWVQAKAADDPTRAIREYLSGKIALVVKAAKESAENIVPPQIGRKYMLLDLETSEMAPPEEDKE